MKKTALILSALFIFAGVYPSSAAAMNILVNPFKNTGSADFSWISAGMTDTVINDLSRIRDVNVISDADREKATREIELQMTGIVSDETIARVGRIMGAGVIFTGTYLVAAGNKIRVVARLINVETAKTERSAKLDGTIDAIFELQDKIVLSLMAEMEKIEIKNIRPVVLTAADEKRIIGNKNPGLEEFKLYSRGLEVRFTDPHAALNYYRKAIAMDPGYVEALKEAGFTAGNTLNLLDEGLGYLDRAEKILRSRGETETIEYADILKNNGIIFRIKGDSDTALRYYLDSKAVAERIGARTTFVYSRVVMNIGNIYRRKGQQDIALDYYAKSRAAADDGGFRDTYDYARLMSNFGASYLKKGDRDAALEYLERSVKIYDSLGFSCSADYGFALTYAGSLCREKGQFDQAMKYLMKAKAVDEKLGLRNHEDYGLLMLSIGKVYMDQGKPDRAFMYYSDSKKTYEGLGIRDHYNYAELLGELARYYEEKGDKKSAGEYYRDSFMIYDKIGYTGEAKGTALKNAERMGH